MATPTRAIADADVRRADTCTPHSASLPATGRRSDGWDALKGIAIIAVVTIHASFGATRALPRGVAVASSGLGLAVPTFMVLSALLASREAVRGSATTPVVRRVVRLLPLYAV